MPTVRLTKTIVEKLTFEGKQTEYFDTKLTGFGVRVNQNSKSYFVYGRVKSKSASIPPEQFKETIGRTTVVSFDDAQTRAEEILRDAAQGISPEDRRKEHDAAQVTLAKQKKRDREKDVTLWQVYEGYKRTNKTLKKSSEEEYDRNLKLNLADWIDEPIRNITGEMVLTRHAEIGEKSPAIANGTMRVLRAIFNYALEAHEEIVVRNPVKKLSTLKAWYTVERKTNFIPPALLPFWLDAVESQELGTGRDIILTLLFTGARKEEVTTLTWKDIDAENKAVIFRETKTGKPLEVPLAGYIFGVLEQRKARWRSKDYEFVFKGTGKEGHFGDLRRTCERIAKDIQKLEEEHIANLGEEGKKLEPSGFTFTPHDLRRTFISYANDIGISPYTIKRLVNHALPADVTQGYVGFTLEKLRVDVEAIAQYIMTKAGRTDGAKVVNLEEKRKEKQK